MKLSTNLKALTAAAVMAVPAIAPTTAAAEVSYNASVSSMYLFRGTDSAGAAQVAGGVDYNNDTGVYVGAWTSSAGGASEIDMYVGYAGEASGLSYDISYWSIENPAPGSSASYETALSLGYDKFSLGLVDGDGDYTYTTLGAEFGSVSLTYGMMANDTSGDYSHLDIAFAATDALTLTLSLPQDDTAGVAEEPLYVVTYSLPIGK
jgi:uncharacterized protein (TIGR02001 family)